MNEKKSFFTRLNGKINQLSKLSLVLILLVYTLLLTGIVALTSINKKYLIIPEYEHVYFNEDLNPEITIIAKRTFDDNDKMSLSYSIQSKTYGRISESSSLDPAYNMSSYKISAGTVDNLYSSKISNMYYFTEYNNYTTTVTHYYTLDNASVNQHPSTIYSMVQYKKHGESVISTFKEDIMLQPTEADKLRITEYYDKNAVTNYTSANMYDEDGYKFANIQFINSEKDADSDVYKMGVKITMSSLSYKSKHHVDMQSWILTEDGKYLPFIGVYSYSSQKSNYVSSTTDVNKKLKPVYICSKLVYYFGENDSEEYYFMQDITKLNSAFETDPTSGEEVNEKESNNFWTKVLIGTGIGIVFVGATFAIVFVINKNNKKKAKESEETLEENKIKE